MLIQKYTSNEIVPDFIEINNREINHEKDIKLIGITIDVKLKFDKDINNWCKNVAMHI